MSQKPRPCSSTCESFTCGQRSLFLKGRTAWCRFVDDECEVRNCKYAQCVKGRLLPSGICGLDVVPKTAFEVEPDRTIQPIKAPAKLAQKLREKELY